MALMTLSAADLLFDVLEGSISLALDGAPIATLELPEDAAPPTGAASILLAQEDADPVVFAGTIVFSRAYEGRVSVLWVGGGGALGGNVGLSSVHYRTVTQPVQLADVVRDIVSGAGESLDDPDLASLSGLTVDRWTRLWGETWSTALGRALKDTGRRWRILDTGLVWVGEETWPAAELDGLELDEDIAGQVVHVGYDRATLRPGTALPDGRHVVRCTFGSNGRLEVELDEDLASPRALAALVAPHLPPNPYTLVWSAEVVRQNADGTLDLRARDEDVDKGVPFEDLPSVPYDCGLHNGRFVLAQGSHVRVRFLAGRPDGALAFGRPTAVGANKGVARAGDHGVTGTLSITGAGSLTITYTPPGGAGVTVGTITAAVAGSPVVFAGAATINLETLLDRVSEEVFLS